MEVKNFQKVQILNLVYAKKVLFASFHDHKFMLSETFSLIVKS